MNIKKLESGNVLITEENLEGPLNKLEQVLEEEAAKCDSFGAISPIILRHDDKIFWHGGSVLRNNAMPYSYAAGESNIGQYPGTRECEVLPFSCMLVSAKLFEKTPLREDQDTDIFEAANYCLTAIANGFKMYATAEISVKRPGEKGTLENVVDFENKFAMSAGHFKTKWGQVLKEHGQLPVCYHAGIGQPTGFAAAARGYLKGLTQLGIDVRYRYLHADPLTEQQVEDEYINDIAEAEPDMDMPQVIWAQAPWFFKNSGKYKIGHCEFEGHEWPASWIKQCNMMDEIWVPTKWDRNKAIKGGVRVPIHVIHQGIDPAYFHPGIEPMRIKIPQRFKFIVNAAWLHRKNLPNLIRTFAGEFSKDESVALVIKTMNVGLVKSIEEEIKKLNIPDNSGWVYVKEEAYPEHQMGSFYTMGDVFVLPTHGEAWGLPVFEALACGVPVLTTAYGAPNEVLRYDDKEPFLGVEFLDYTMSTARDNYEYLRGKKWAEPNLIQLASKMREMYNNIDEYKANALQGSKEVREKFAWNKVCMPIAERLADIYKNKMQ